MFLAESILVAVCITLVGLGLLYLAEDVVYQYFTYPRIVLTILVVFVVIIGLIVFEIWYMP